MHTIYFIPGLGADERLFSRLKLEGFEKRFVRWLPPFKKETLPEYASRLSSQIDSKNKFSLIGVSFGGMVAVEIARKLHPENLILISSVAAFKEIPWFLKIFKYFPVYHLMPEAFIQWLAKMNVHRFGIYKDDEKKLFSDMLYSCPKGYLKGAINMVMHWKGQDPPEITVHIHGENDRLFPVGNIKKPLVVKGGTHFMPYHNAEEVEKIMREKMQQ